MDTFTQTFVLRAEAGGAVPITEARNSYMTLPPSQSFAVQVDIETIDGACRAFHWRLPRFARYPEKEKTFVIDYFLAQMSNLAAGLGGRGAVVHNPDNAEEMPALIAAFDRAFGQSLPRHERRGFGVYLNVAERMVQALAPAADGQDARFVLRRSGSCPAPSEKAPTRRGAADMFANAARGLEGKAILGVDVGGTDIKLALAVDGRLVRCEEYDWNPSAFTRMDQMIDPLRALIGGMGAAALAAGARGTAGGETFRFDAIGMCFPDVVVNDKIVGGDGPKLRGIRDALGDGFDRALVGLANLDDELARDFVGPGGVVGIVNDGTMAAFAAGVEMAVARPGAVANGVFAYTLGTDFGAGWIDEAGGVPPIPLEAYNFTVDLGSRPERAFPAGDLRSVNNFNTGLPGSLQRYASQAGVFRMAWKSFSLNRPELARELRERGFVAETTLDGKPALVVPTAPRDMRKPFLEFVMQLAEKGGEPATRAIFGEVGAALAAASEEIDWILSPAAKRRMLFGRLVKLPGCFEAMRKGAADAGSGVVFEAADETLAETPLMRELARSAEYTVAQFGQAVGAVYYGNYRLRAGADG